MHWQCVAFEEIYVHSDDVDDTNGGGNGGINPAETEDG